MTSRDTILALPSQRRGRAAKTQGKKGKGFWERNSLQSRRILQCQWWYCSALPPFWTLNSDRELGRVKKRFQGRGHGLLWRCWPGGHQQCNELSFKKTLEFQASFLFPLTLLPFLSLYVLTTADLTLCVLLCANSSAASQFCASPHYARRF